jgi:hypothetical protein
VAQDKALQVLFSSYESSTLAHLTYFKEICKHIHDNVEVVCNLAEPATLPNLPAAAIAPPPAVWGPSAPTAECASDHRPPQHRLATGHSPFRSDAGAIYSQTHQPLLHIVHHPNVHRK